MYHFKILVLYSESAWGEKFEAISDDTEIKSRYVSIRVDYCEACVLCAVYISFSLFDYNYV